MRSMLGLEKRRFLGAQSCLQNCKAVSLLKVDLGQVREDDELSNSGMQ